LSAYARALVDWKVIWAEVHAPFRVLQQYMLAHWLYSPIDDPKMVAGKTGTINLVIKHLELLHCREKSKSVLGDLDLVPNQ
jgi:hypothetical protein